LAHLLARFDLRIVGADAESYVVVVVFVVWAQAGGKIASDQRVQSTQVGLFVRKFVCFSGMEWLEDTNVCFIIPLNLI